VPRSVAVVNAAAGTRRIGGIRRTIDCPDISAACEAVAEMMQRNVYRLRCRGFVLGIPTVDDYGRAPWNEGLY
jgi:hypothetical protein